ncbi:hypothetical protein Tco_0609529 [Tanacetum coccineum]
MTSTAAQQVTLDSALVAPENLVQIGKCNMRIDPTKTQKEPIYQVVLDSLALSLLYPAFLITAKVLEIYMHQFWHTITKIKNSSSYKFKLDKKKCTINVEFFWDILQIYPRLLNQEFDASPSDEEMVTFIKELGHKGDIKFVTEVVVDQIHQPWRTFATIINRCLFGKTSGLDKFRLSRAQISIGGMDTPTYKTYLAFATGAATPKKARKFKKLTSPSKKKTLVTVEEPVEKLVKKPTTKRQSTSVQIKDTPGVSVSKKKAPTKAERSKWIELLSEATLLEEAQLKKAIKRSKREINIHQAGGSSEGADLESEVLDEPKDKPIDTSEGTGSKPRVLNMSKADSFESEYDSWGDKEIQEDDFVHTPEDYVPTDDENVDDEEYYRINKEMYDDVNVELKDAEPVNEEKGNEEMTYAEQLNAEHEEVSQEVVGDQVKDDAQEIVTADLATQKTEVPLQISFNSSDYATKFLNFDNIPSVIPETSTAPTTTIPPHIPPFIPLPQQSTPIPTPTSTEVPTSTTIDPDSSTLSAIHQRVSDLEKEVKELKNVDHSSTLLATIKSKVPNDVKKYFGTSLDDALYKVLQRYTADLTKEHSGPADVVEKLKQQYKP